MSYRMAYRGKRDDSSVEQFRMRVPEAVKDRVRGKRVLIWFPDEGGNEPVPVTTTIGPEVKFSLRTRDPAIAEHRTLIARAHLQRIFAAAEKGPTKLSNRNLVALSKGVYDLFIEVHQEEPGSVNRWAAFKAFTRAAMEGRISEAPPVVPGEEADIDEAEQALEAFGRNLTEGINALPKSDDTDALEQRFGLMTDWLLAKNGIEVDTSTRTILLRLVGMAAHDAGWQLKRNAGGNYSPDPAIARYPTMSPIPGTVSARTLSEVWDQWKREKLPSASTVSTWKGVVASLKKYLGHEVVSRISEEDLIAWKDSLIESGLRLKTISHSYIAAIKALLSYEVDNKRLTKNPASAVKVGLKKKAGQRKLPYSDNEVARILSLARTETNASRRWLPWLAAFSGARIGELAQLWGSRIKQVDGIYVMEIRPAEDGGSLKNEGSERIVPLHPGIIDEGFLEFVRRRGSGPLFYGKSSGDPSKKHASKGVSNRLAAWIRESGFTDDRKAPNHAFRHWFKTSAIRAGMLEPVIDVIMGHEDSSARAVYSHVHLPTLHSALASVRVPALEEEDDKEAEDIEVANASLQ